MFGTVRNKTNMLPLALVLAAVSGVFLAESGVKFAAPAFAANILDTASNAGADQSPGGINFDNLVRIDKKLYNITVDDYVDTNPISSSVVKKISAGRVFNVNIATTTTGTYSTDSLRSKHVLYPGINVEEVKPRYLFTSAVIFIDAIQGQNIRHFIRGLDDFVASGVEGCEALGSYIGCK